MFDEVLKGAERMAVNSRRIVDGLTDDDLQRVCERPPAPGYPEKARTVGQCIRVVLDEEIEHLRYATRDLAVLEARQAAGCGAAARCDLWSPRCQRT